MVKGILGARKTSRSREADIVPPVTAACNWQRGTVISELDKFLDVQRRTALAGSQMDKLMADINALLDFISVTNIQQYIH